MTLTLTEAAPDGDDIRFGLTVRVMLMLIHGDIEEVGVALMLALVDGDDERLEAALFLTLGVK